MNDSTTRKTIVSLTACMAMLLLLLSTPFLPEASSSAEKTRPSAIAGTWYPGSATDLRRQIEGFLSQASVPDIPGQLTALIVPHAGYVFSGQVAAYAYKLLEKRKFETVVVIGPSHHARFQGVSVYDRGGFETPLGVAPLDRDLISALEKRDSRIRFVEDAHTMEHSVEIQVPFLQVVMPGFKLVPLVMGDQDLSTCRWLADAIADTTRGRSVLVVASSDLSHFHAYEKAKLLDQVVQDKGAAMDPQGLYTGLATGECEACGGGPIVTAMLEAQRRESPASRVLYYANSGDVTGDRQDVRGVVGYMAAAIWSAADGKPPQEAAVKKPGIDLGLTAEEKTLLHKLARETIEARCRGAKAPRVEAATATLKERRGAFVTLYKKGELRGCIGYIIATKPLADTIAEMAEAAAFHDPRFMPVSADELKDIKIEISVLTPLKRIDNIDEIQVGTHGIYMKQGFSSGLLLPQVATEYGWDRLTFLKHTCLKAGIREDAWKDKSTEIFIFSADIF
jgi:MEMO1 family protein